MANATKMKSIQQKKAVAAKKKKGRAAAPKVVDIKPFERPAPRVGSAAHLAPDQRSMRTQWSVAEFVTIIRAKEERIHADKIRPMLLRDHGTVRTQSAINAQYSSWKTNKLGEAVMIAIESVLYDDDDDDEEAAPAAALDMGEPANRAQLGELVGAIESFEQRLQPVLDEVASLKTALAEIRRRAADLAAALDLVKG